jgi:2-polyprenyl-3-methyl-5-hydroxy-6-metoxy-1,4-benzoquinol methylase
MINWLHSRLYRPERGWDPVPASHVAQYSSLQWEQGVRADLLDQLDDWSGGLSGKSVLDLGGGPGQYSVAFAQRGARVTWLDVSARYRSIAQERARAAGVELQYQLGYMDEAARALSATFDIVFNRICWNYGRGDGSFSRVVWSLLRPGGVAYVDTSPDDFSYDSLSAAQKVQVWLNRHARYKVGHPFPPRGRLAMLFARFPSERLLIDNSLPMNDRIFIRKRR